MNENDESSERQPPVVMAALACLICCPVMYWAAGPAMDRLEAWWAKLLFYSLIPLLVTFITLYRSCWHREMAGAARTGCLVVLSCVIFCSDLVIIGILVAVFSIFVGINRGHP